MPAHMSKKELEDLINATKAAGNDTTMLEQLLNEAKPERPAVSKPRAAPSRELVPVKQEPQELVTSPEEMARLRTLACPHIKDSPYWEVFISRRVLVCTDCQHLRPGEFGEHRQPPLF